MRPKSSSTSNRDHNRPIRLLVVTTVGITIQAFLRPHIKYWRQRGWMVDGASESADTDQQFLELFDRFHGVHWSRRPIQIAKQWKGFLQIRRIMLTGCYDLVHVHTPVAGFITRLAARTIQQSQRPLVVYTAHGFHFHKHGSRLGNFVFKALEKIASNGMDYLITINKEDYDAARALSLTPNERTFRTAGIGVDLSDYSLTPERHDRAHQLRMGLGIGPSERVILMIAQLDKGKRHEDCIKGLAKIQRSDTHLVLLGEGPERSNLKALTNALDLSNRVHFEGFSPEVPSWLAAADVLAFTSEREGLPRCLMEGMAAHIPIVATNIRGNAELIERGAGRSFEVGDVQALAEQLESAIENDDTNAQMVEIAGERVSHYSIKFVLGEIAGIYQHAIAERFRRSSQLDFRKRKSSTNQPLDRQDSDTKLHDT